VWTGGDGPAADYIFDLEAYPQAYVIGCLAQRSSSAERAWRLPYLLRERLGSLDVEFLAGQPEEDLSRAIGERPSLHRFPPTMASNIKSAMGRIVETHDGDPALIWSGEPSVATVVRRFIELDGIGPKIATMATILLVNFYKVPMRDLHLLDLPVDVQIRRVFQRLGLVRESDYDEAIVLWARELWPDFPGMVDVALWEVGRELCRPANPRCDRCFLAEVCAFAISVTGNPQAG
jgi:uncharacterized HhH-GPD family protein